MAGSKATGTKGFKADSKASASKRTSNPPVDDTFILRTRAGRVSKRIFFAQLASSPPSSRSRSRRTSGQTSRQNSRTVFRAISIDDDDVSSENVDDDMNVEELELELEQTTQARIIRRRIAMLRDEAKARAELREVKNSINAMGVHDSRSPSHALIGGKNHAVATISATAVIPSRALPPSPFDDVRAFQSSSRW